MFFILASYCGPCAKNIVDNNDFLLSIKNKNVRFIGLFVESDTEKTNKFIKRYNIDDIFDDNIYSFDNKYITIRSNDKTSKFNKDNIKGLPYHILVNDKTKEITTYEGMLSENDKTKINQMLTSSTNK